MLISLLAEFFITPIPITGAARLGMLVPLALAISIVYKTIRCDKLSAIPLASLGLCFMIITIMMLIGTALLGVFHLLA